MDQEKPFKTIEVIDSDTKQVCKIACMSCIRGHRTTSCGIPVCRTKIFWTVKRPGRPSNSCTCRFQSSGVCKCVTALPKCPHKAKKGEKRSSECRCDEQGRFCCLLESGHWDTLFALEKPTVRFFANREALEEAQDGNYIRRSSSAAFPSTSSCCGGGSATSSTIPTPRMSQTPVTSPRESLSTSASPRPLVPRFGFMGVGGPMGSDSVVSPDVMTWSNDTPMSPTVYAPVSEEPEEMGSCCGRSRADEYQHGDLPYSPPTTQYDASYSSYQPTPAPPQPYVFDFDRWNQNYQIYQFPNAICQNCGLNGCTCRSCPPLMQNYGTTSWAQSCGRRHARIAPMPQPVPAAAVQQQPQAFKADRAHVAQPVNGISHHYSPVSPHLDGVSQHFSPIQQPTNGITHHFTTTQQDYITLPDMNMDMDRHEHQRPHELPFHTNGHVLTNGFGPHDPMLAPSMTEPLGFTQYATHRPEPPDHINDHDMFGG